MSTQEIIVDGYIIGPLIGKGAFGSIFAAKDEKTNQIYAIKTEIDCERKTLFFEQKVMIRTQQNPYVPRYIGSGAFENQNYIVMELVGPSIQTIIHSLALKKFSISTGLRVAYHSFIAIKCLHEAGFLHRDIKPSNILIRVAKSVTPICIIDFGLVRLYRDQITNEILPKRERTGFRGTRVYASLNAHMMTDLSRADDLISWFYLILDIINGSLPWKGLDSVTDVILAKQQFDAKSLTSFAPSLYEIWKHINSLGYEDEPDYAFIEKQLISELSRNNVQGNEPYDWEDFVYDYKERLIASFQMDAFDDLVSIDAKSARTQLGIPSTVGKYINHKGGSLHTTLIKEQDYSIMQQSELNERSNKCGC